MQRTRQLAPAPAVARVVASASYRLPHGLGWRGRGARQETGVTRPGPRVSRSQAAKHGARTPATPKSIIITLSGGGASTTTRQGGTNGSMKKARGTNFSPFSEQHVMLPARICAAARKRLARMRSSMEEEEKCDVMRGDEGWA